MKSPEPYTKQHDKTKKYHGDHHHAAASATKDKLEARATSKAKVGERGAKI